VANITGISGQLHRNTHVYYYIPAPGQSFTLDNTTGEDKIYLVAAKWPIEKALAESSVAEREPSDSIETYKTLAIRVIAVSSPPVISPQKPSSQNTQRVIERIEGHGGGLVRALTFNHR
jgi:hypothetical protein